MSINVNDKNIGHATAYAYAVAGGYTGTKAEFTELLGNIADDLEQIENLTVTVETLAAGSIATASYSNGVLHLGIPKGDKGDKGDTGATGPTGPTGNGIASVAKTGTSGLVDTYTITYTNGNTSTFTVTNGAEAVDNTLTIAGRAADAKETGDEISELKEDLTDKADTVDMLKAFPTDTASGSVASFADGANVPVKSLVVNIDPVQSGSGDPSPDNVRPISGWSEVNVQRTGVNLFPYKDIESQTKNGVTITVEKSNGAITNIHMQGTATTAFSIPFYINGEDDQWVLPKGDCKLYIGGDKPTQGQIFDINIRKAGETSDISAASTVRTITLSEQTAFRSAYIWIYSGAVLNHNIIPVIVQSGVDTSVKYPVTQRQSITIDLEQTVYGGTLDVVSGVLTVDYEHLLFDGSENWGLQSINSHGIANFARTASIPSYTTPVDLICNRLPLQTSIIAETTTEGIMPAGNTNIYIRLNSSRASTVAELKQWLTSNNVEVVYKIRTPLTIQLTPHEVTALLGSNNVWADSGDSEVTYRADPTLYIQRLTEPDADMVADSNITSGQYFMVGNTLYKATANIASGANIVPNVNCTRKSLSEALNEINA